MSIKILLVIASMIIGITGLPVYAQEDQSWLSSQAAELATVLGIVPALENLKTYSLESKFLPVKSFPTQVLSLRLEILESLLLSSFEIHQVIGEIDDEIAHYQEILEALEIKRDRAIRVSNITNLVSSGALSVLGSSIQIGTPLGLQNAGNEIEVVAGGLASGLSSYALKEQQGGHRSMGVHPNMLAQLLGCPTNNRTIYPPNIWLFLSGSLRKEPGEISYKEDLILRWTRAHRIPPTDSRGAMHRFSLIAGTIPQNHEITIDLLTAQIAMLSDVRAAISLMHDDLYEIIKVVHSM